MIHVGKLLAARRVELGLTDVDAAEKSGLTIYQYTDLEAYEHEFWDLISFEEARKVCEALQLNIVELVIPEGRKEEGGAVCEDEICALLKNAREGGRLSIDKVADEIGYEPWVVEKAETEPGFIRTMCLSAIFSLAKALKLEPISLLC